MGKHHKRDQLEADMEQALILKQLDALEAGHSTDFPSVLPALSGQPLQALCTKRDERYWELDLFWYGIRVGQVTAQHTEDDQLALEVL